MKLTNETVRWLGWLGAEQVSLKIERGIQLYVENNTDDPSGCILLESLLTHKAFEEKLYGEWLPKVIPILNDLDGTDFFGTEGWETYVGLSD